jgi:hypothetical protein
MESCFLANFVYIAHAGSGDINLSCSESVSYLELMRVMSYLSNSCTIGGILDYKFGMEIERSYDV